MEDNFNTQIDNFYNHDNVFLRTVGVSLCNTLSKCIRWINRFEDGKKIRVVLPFNLKLAGDERYVADAFLDDIVDRRVDGNTDQLQRGAVTYKTTTQKSTEYANPNQYLSQKSQINNEFRRVISKTKAVPINIEYDIEIRLASEIEALKCWQKIQDSLFNYKFFRIDYLGLPIDAFFRLPDNGTIEIQSEDGLDQVNRYKKITYSLTVETYYPVFFVSVDDLDVCDNDDQIDWEYLGIPRPSNDFCETLKKYQKNFSQDVTCNFGRVFWSSYIYELNSKIKLSPLQ